MEKKQSTGEEKRCMDGLLGGKKEEENKVKTKWGGSHREHLELSAIGDDDLDLWLSGIGSEALDLRDDIHSLGDSSEDDVLAVEPGGLDGAEEELGSVRVWSGVGLVLLGEVLIWKLLSVDGFSAGSVSAREVSSLNHEVWDDAMELASLEVKWLSRLSDSLLTGAQGEEVGGGLWDDVGVELENEMF